MSSTTPTGVPPRNPDPVPPGLLVAGSYAWRIAAIGLVCWGLLQLVARLSGVIIPVAVALILAALLQPAATRLKRWLNLSPYLISAFLLLAFVGAIIQTSVMAGAELATGMQELQDAFTTGLKRVQDWLSSGDLGFGGQTAGDLLNKAQDWVMANQGSVLRGAMTVGGSAATLVTGGLVALVTAFFFLADGARIWSWVINLLPDPAQQPARIASQRGWASLEAYARTQVIVAFVDAIGIALGAILIGVPFALPIGVIVFFTAFVPVVGALASGVVAVLVALAFKGLTAALLMVVVVLIVQQIESNVLQPVLMGKAVQLHPWATIIGVVVGSTLLGIVGALFAVPVMAVANTVIKSLYGRWEPTPSDGPGLLAKVSKFFGRGAKPRRPTKS